MLTVAYSENQI